MEQYSRSIEKHILDEVSSGRSSIPPRGRPANSRQG
jgi:hypothetical protein